MSFSEYPDWLVENGDLFPTAGAGDASTTTAMMHRSFFSLYNRERSARVATLVAVAEICSK